MDEYSMLGVSDILDCFDVEKTSKLIHEQLSSDEYMPGGMIVDHLKPMWVRYKSLKVDPEYDIDESTVNAAKEKFDNICLLFIDEITRRYGITIDIGWLENCDNTTIHSLALIMYSFFVLDIEENIKEVLYKYIVDHIEDLAYHFGDNIKNRKDSPFLSFKKSMPIEYAIVGADIYNVCYWVLDQMSEEEFFNYIDGDYIPQSYIKSLFDDGRFNGHFVQEIYACFKQNSGLRSRICFELISLFKANFGQNFIKEGEDGKQ